MVYSWKNRRTKIVIGFMIITMILAITIFMSLVRKNITVVVDNNPIKLVTYQKTFGSALKKANINLDVKDKIDKSLNSNIVNNDVITITRSINLKVFVDNKELKIKSAEKDVSQMLIAQNIAINPNDKISPSRGTKLSKDMDIRITRVKTQTIQQLKSIDFSTVLKKDDDILKSKRTVSQNGIKGQKNITLSVVYENGKEVTRKVIKETIVKKPQSKIIVQGTKSPVSYSRGITSNISENFLNVNSHSKSLSVKATAYWAFNGVNNTYTASGQKAVRNPNGVSTIAVDPSVIPLGTKLYVQGYGNAIAADSGSGVKGNYIDVFFNTRAEAINFGVRYLKVQILD